MSKTLPRILLTGFDPFGGETINPSWEAAGALQSRGLIRYRRGKVAIIDRERLAAAACTCYRSDLETYRQGMDRWIRKTGVSRAPHAQSSR